MYSFKSSPAKWHCVQLDGFGGVSLAPGVTQRQGADALAAATAAYPDVKVQEVTSFPDLKVETVTAFPDKCGKWQLVNAFPDTKVQIVTAFPDVRVQYVTSFPGLR